MVSQRLSWCQRSSDRLKEVVIISQPPNNVHALSALDLNFETQVACAAKKSPQSGALEHSVPIRYACICIYIYVNIHMCMYMYMCTYMYIIYIHTCDTCCMGYDIWYMTYHIWYVVYILYMYTMVTITSAIASKTPSDLDRHSLGVSPHWRWHRNRTKAPGAEFPVLVLRSVPTKKMEVDKIMKCWLNPTQ